MQSGADLVGVVGRTPSGEARAAQLREQENLAGMSGRHCQYPLCGRFDFLPSKCPICALFLCADHHKPSDHGCEIYTRKLPTCPICSQLIALENHQPEDEAINAHIESGCKSNLKADKQKAREEASACSFGRGKKKCKDTSLIKMICKECNRQFCVKHRTPAIHKCKGPPTAKSIALASAKAAEARQRKASAQAAEARQQLSAARTKAAERTSGAGPEGPAASTQLSRQPSREQVQQILSNDLERVASNHSDGTPVHRRPGSPDPTDFTYEDATRLIREASRENARKALAAASNSSGQATQDGAGQMDLSPSSDLDFLKDVISSLPGVDISHPLFENLQDDTVMGEAAQPTAANLHWACSTCTFLNPADTQTCEMCATSRPAQ